MIILVIVSLLLLVAILLLVWRNHYINYTDPRGQLLKGGYANSTNVSDGTLGVVTWNLHFGEKLDEIILTLENSSEFQGKELLLLQEINGEGAKKIARQLRYNYIYYPTVFSRQRGDEYGLAILSKWPLEKAERILLPNWLPGWVENRFVIKAITSVNGKNITIYNTHLDVAWMRHQGEFLGEELASPEGLTILGGDFNTWQPSSITELESLLQAVGMERLTRKTGYSFEYLGSHFILDHIFSNEAQDYTAGGVHETDASDHFPVWAEIAIDPK